MAIMSKIPLYAIEDMLNIYGESLWTNILLPDEIIKQTLIDNIMMQAEDRPVLYTDPDFLRKRIEVWFTKNYDNFEAMIAALLKDYDIFDNYHREKEEWENIDETVNKTEDGEYDSEYENYAEHAEHKTRDHNESTNTKAAFDSNTYEPFDKNVTDNTTDNNGDSEGNGSEGGTNHRESENVKDNDRYLKYKVKGKLGVTSYQELIQKELELRKFNIYDYITNQFLREFIILVSM